MSSKIDPSLSPIWCVFGTQCRWQKNVPAELEGVRYCPRMKRYVFSRPLNVPTSNSQRSGAYGSRYIAVA